MERDPLNFFQPFESLSPNHENQLTRALLLVLSLCPIAHECWLARLDTGRRLYELPQPAFDTQRRAIALKQDREEPLPLVSVYLAPGPSLTKDTMVLASDRTQVLDAIIAYPGALVVVVENKIGDDVDWQAGNINITGVAVKLSEGQKPVAVRWPDLLMDFNGILERGLVGGAEAALLSDFLVYVEDHFPGLGPYQTLRLSARDAFRVERRLRAVLSEATDREARIDRWGPCADALTMGGMGSRVYLRAHEDMSTIELSIFPADTLTQARVFYARPNAIVGARRLAATDGWAVTHNFHFGHFQGGYVWTNGEIGADEYLDLWTDQVKQTEPLPREEWPKYFEWLKAKRIAVEDDRAEFDRIFTNTTRSRATPRPGVCVTRLWPIAEAEELDTRGELALRVREALATMVAELGP